MLISIIVPVYKVESYIRQCVESIINQSCRNLEIILVDDGSPDNCPEICEEYAKQDERIKVIHQENKGLIEARKSGLRAATGEYVCFVDGDDWIEPEMYSKIADAIDKHSPDCVITEFFYSYPDKEIPSKYCFNREVYNREELENEVFPIMLFNGTYYNFGVYPNCWTKVFRKEILEKHLYSVDSRIRIGEDIAFTYPCLTECNCLSYIDLPLYHYRINQSSMTKSYDSSLKSIYLLPYEALLKCETDNNIGLSAQLPYYLLYLINFLLRNEALKNEKNKYETASVIKSITENEAIHSAVNNIDSSLLPKHTKLLLKALKSRNPFFVKQYINLLRKVI